jgi:hypothetical protein
VLLDFHLRVGDLPGEARLVFEFGNKHSKMYLNAIQISQRISSNRR